MDDEPDNRELLQIVLGWDGFVTETANNGEEALASAAQPPADLMLLDLMMPGLDDCQVTTLLKQNLATKNIPVMIISAMNDHATRMRVRGAGAEEFITGSKCSKDAECELEKSRTPTRSTNPSRSTPRAPAAPAHRARSTGRAARPALKCASDGVAGGWLLFSRRC